MSKGYAHENIQYELNIERTQMYTILSAIVTNMIS